MQIARLQYISQGVTTGEHLDNIQKALEAGCRWIQLRIKDQDDESILIAAQKAKSLCDAFNAVLIINDKPDIAKAINANGVHLGKEDASPIDVRMALGEEFTIGGTANTLEDIRQLSKAGVNYIGLGPLRFTSTKKKLSPLLGFEGYETILQQMEYEGISIPVIAIGGVVAYDLPKLMNSGIYGVAVSSVITNATNREETVNNFINTLSETLSPVNHE